MLLTPLPSSAWQGIMKRDVSETATSRSAQCEGEPGGDDDAVATEDTAGAAVDDDTATGGGRSPLLNHPNQPPPVLLVDSAPTADTAS